MVSKSTRVGFALLAFAGVLAVGGLGAGETEPAFFSMFLGGLGFLVVFIGAFVEWSTPPPRAP